MMTGRQWLLANPALIDDIAQVHGVTALARDPGNAFAKPFFRMLGAQTIDAIDCSDYESATVVHDLNCQVTADFQVRYDLVFDGGTFEHAFNLPTALKSCL